MKVQERFHRLLAIEAHLRGFMCELTELLNEVIELREEAEKKLQKIREKRRKTGN